MPESSDQVHSGILRIRGCRVILDADLARLYGVPNKRLNEQVRRNREKFPEDFCFQLTKDETANLKSQIATSSSEHGGARKLPWAFTEHGALMAANILRSPPAAKMAIYVVRAFVKQREMIATNATILKRLAEVDKTLLEHDTALQVL
ncbi:MAG: ORF6N domain-containing protein [Lacunisphaera sp.]